MGGRAGTGAQQTGQNVHVTGGGHIGRGFGGGLGVEFLLSSLAALASVVAACAHAAGVSTVTSFASATCRNSRGSQTHLPSARLTRPCRVPPKMRSACTTPTHAVRSVLQPGKMMTHWPNNPPCWPGSRLGDSTRARFCGCSAACGNGGSVHDVAAHGNAASDGCGSGGLASSDGAFEGTVRPRGGAASGGSASFLGGGGCVADVGNGAREGCGCCCGGFGAVGSSS